MTEETIQRELASTETQLRMWWINKIPETSYPKKLANKIKFLRGYLVAIKNLKNDDLVRSKVNEITDKKNHNARRLGV